MSFKLQTHTPVANGLSVVFYAPSPNPNCNSLAPEWVESILQVCCSYPFHKLIISVLAVKLVIFECPLMLSQRWFGAVRQQAITVENVDPDLCRNMVSLGHNKFHSSITSPVTKWSTGKRWRTRSVWIILEVSIIMEILIPWFTFRIIDAQPFDIRRETGFVRLTIEINGTLKRVVHTLGIYSLERRRFMGIGFAILNLRRSNGCLRCMMGILLPKRQCLLSE